MSLPAMAFPNAPTAADAWRDAANRGWSRPPDVRLSDWLDANYRPDSVWGAWRTLPFQVGIADAFTDPEIEHVTLMKSARVGFTKLLVGYLCYRVVCDPGDSLVVQPTVDDAKGFSKEDLAPALEATPAVAEIIGRPRSRDSANTIRRKKYRGGSLRLIGANTGTGFRRITVDNVEFDEIDAYPMSAGGEGDPIELGKKRAHTAAFPKFILGSSPKVKETSRILASWNESDQRDFIVPCPHCQAGQRLRWGGRDCDFGIKWDGDDPETAYYLCAHCHAQIDEKHKLWMIEQGLAHQGSGGGWVAGSPGVIGHAGFRIWAAYSPFPAARWAAIAAEFLKSKDDPVRLQVFVNTVLGEPWEAKYTSLDDGRLMMRREQYPTRPAAEPKSPPVMLAPRGVAIFTSHVDVQDDRLEAQRVGWGALEEGWVYDHRVFYGDPSVPQVWDTVHEHLVSPIPLERGGVDYVRAATIDTGGHHTIAAYDFCKPRFRVRLPDKTVAHIFATKGQPGTGTIWPARASRRNVRKILLWSVKVDPAKEAMFERLRRVERPGPGYIHFPMTLGETFFQQLESEALVVTRNSRGFLVRTFKLRSVGRRNETWDCLVGAYVALRGLIDGMGFDFNRRVARVAQLVERLVESGELAPIEDAGAVELLGEPAPVWESPPHADDPPPDDPPPPPPRPTRRRSRGPKTGGDPRRNWVRNRTRGGGSWLQR